MTRFEGLFDIATIRDIAEFFGPEYISIENDDYRGCPPESWEVLEESYRGTDILDTPVENIVIDEEKHWFKVWLSEEASDMTYKDVVDAVMSYEVDNGGAAYEMMVDGYDGDFTAYADDYRGDYDTEEVAEGVVVRLPHTGEAWLVWKDTGAVSKNNDLHVYEVIDNKDRTILKTTDEAEALALIDAGKGVTYFEDGSVVEW